MEFIKVFACVMLVVLICCIVGYVYITNRTINDLQKKIAKLRTENFRLQAKHRTDKNVQVIEIHDHSIDPDNMPEFGDA